MAVINNTGDARISPVAANTMSVSLFITLYSGFSVFLLAIITGESNDWI